MTEPLRLSQIRLPALQLLGQLLVLSHIHCGADNSFQDPGSPGYEADNHAVILYLLNSPSLGRPRPATYDLRRSQ